MTCWGAAAMAQVLVPLPTEAGCSAAPWRQGGAAAGSPCSAGCSQLPGHTHLPAFWSLQPLGRCTFGQRGNRSLSSSLFVSLSQTPLEEPLEARLWEMPRCWWLCLGVLGSPSEALDSSGQGKHRDSSALTFCSVLLW